MATSSNEFLAPAETQLRIAVVGGLQAEIGDVKLDITKQKAIAMLALLIIDAPNPTSRAMLRGLLWSDSGETAAQNSLRNTLFVLRKHLEACGYNGLFADRTKVWLDPDSFGTDLDEYKAALAEGIPSPKLFPDNGFPENILAGVEATDLFEQRVTTFRTTTVHQIVDICASAVSECAPEHKVALLQLLIALRPLNEAHYRALISTLVDQGRNAEALSAYQKLWNILDEEYGEEPSLETQAIVVALKQVEDTRAPSIEGKPVIILRSASQNMSVQGVADMLGNLRELTLSVLSRFREWRIIDDRYCPDLDSLKDQSNGLVCALSLFQTMPEALQAQAVLTDLRTGQVLWSETLTFNPKTKEQGVEFTIKKLATAMNLHLSGPLHPGVTTTQDDANLQYERWIGAQQLMRQFTCESWDHAQDILDDILKDNPNFVRALASRASVETMRQIAFPGLFSTPSMHRRALKWASAATLVDPMDSRAQLSLAWACAMSRQFDRAEIAYELAFQHNENDPWTITSAMVGFAFCDKMKRAQSLLSYLLDLNLSMEPVHWSYMAAAKFLAEDDEACVEMSKSAREISCDVPAWHAAALAHMGRLDEARAIAVRFRELVVKHWAGSHTPNDYEITTWILSCFPIRARSKWNRLRHGLELAGLKLPSQ